MISPRPRDGGGHESKGPAALEATRSGWVLRILRTTDPLTGAGAPPEHGADAAALSQGRDSTSLDG